MPYDEFQQQLDHLIGMSLWGIVGGAGTGSMVSLDLGPMIPRSRPLNNPHLTDLVRNNEAGWGFHIQHAAWRVETDTEVCCSWKSGNEEGGEMMATLDRLLQTTLTIALIAEPSGDLYLGFSNGLKWTVFCDCADEEEDGTNYTFFTPEWSFSVAAKGMIHKDRRSTNGE